MRNLSTNSWFPLVFLGIVVGLPGSALAEPPGFVRISEGMQPIPEWQPLPANNAIGAVVAYDGTGCVGENCDGGDDARCPVLNDCCLPALLPFTDGCTHSPDYGWSRPVKYPIRRVPVQYHRYWPTRWYGEPGTVPPRNTNRRFPMVYMPTDTAQLGFYYQRVPQWRPNPAMIPPAPWPTHWHHREWCGNSNNSCPPTVEHAFETSPEGVQPAMPNGGAIPDANNGSPMGPPDPTAYLYRARVRPAGL